MQVEQRQHLADLRGLPCPGRQDRRGEPLAFARGLVEALVVHARGLDLDDSGGGGDVPRVVMAVAHDQAVTAIVPLTGQLGYVSVDFRLQGGSQHPLRALADDLTTKACRARQAGLGTGGDRAIW